MKRFFEKIAAKSAASEKIVTIFLLVLVACIPFIVSECADRKAIIGEIAGYVNLIAYFPYLMSILRGETKPSKVTWWVWSTLEIMMTASYIMSGAESTKWLPIASCAGMILTAILSIWYGKKGWSNIDSICLAGSIIGIVVWILSGVPIIALVCFLVVDLLALIPTCVKSWKNPKEEDLFAWIITLLSGFINLFAVEFWNFSIGIFPVYSIFIYIVVVAILIYKRC